MKRIIITLFLLLLLITPTLGCDSIPFMKDNKEYRNDKYGVSFSYPDDYKIFEYVYPENRGSTIYLYNHLDEVSSDPEEAVDEITEKWGEVNIVRVFVAPTAMETTSYDSYEWFYYAAVTAAHDNNDSFTLVNASDATIDGITVREFKYTLQVEDPENPTINGIWKKDITAFLNTYHDEELEDCTTYKIICMAHESVYSDSAYRTVIDTMNFY